MKLNLRILKSDINFNGQHEALSQLCKERFCAIGAVVMRLKPTYCYCPHIVFTIKVQGVSKRKSSVAKYLFFKWCNI